MEESAEAKGLDAFRLNKDELKSSAEGVKYNAMQGDIDDAASGEFVVALLVCFLAVNPSHFCSPANCI